MQCDTTIELCNLSGGCQAIDQLVYTYVIQIKNFRLHSLLI